MRSIIRMFLVLIWVLCAGSFIILHILQEMERQKLNRRQLPINLLWLLLRGKKEMWLEQSGDEYVDETMCLFSAGVWCTYASMVSYLLSEPG